MKKLFFFAALFIVTGAFGQNAPDVFNASLSRDTNIVFRGFNNLITIQPAKGDTLSYSLIGSNCNLATMADDGNYLPDHQYILKAGRDSVVKLSVVMLTPSNQVVVKHIETFSVQNLPVPDIRINNLTAKDALARNANLIEVKYGPEIPLEFQLDVTGWTMLIDGAIYTGVNYLITDEVKMAIRMLPAGSEVQVKVMATDRVDGVTHAFESVFKVE